MRTRRVTRRFSKIFKKRFERKHPIKSVIIVEKWACTEVWGE
jgi:hypothetical protein